MVDTQKKTLTDLDFGVKGHHSQRQKNGTNGHEVIILAEFSTATKDRVKCENLGFWRLL